MPVDNGYGWSWHTPIKQAHYAEIVYKHVNVVAGMLGVYPKWIYPAYHLLDVTAGWGIDPATGKDGSPLVFLRRVMNLPMPYRCWFFEKEREQFESLQKKVVPVREDDRCIGLECVHASFEHRLLETAREIKERCRGKQAFGLLYYDPTGEAIPDDLIHLLKRFNRILPRMDILINISATNVKRTANSTACTNYRPLKACLNDLDRKVWLIREIHRGDAFQWTFVLGTGYSSFPNLEQIGLYRTTTAKGEAILHKANFTREQQKSMRALGQLALPLGATG
jgi:hypothetical protein